MLRIALFKSCLIVSAKVIAVCRFLGCILNLHLNFGSFTEQERETEGKRGGNFEEGSGTNQGADQET